MGKKRARDLEESQAEEEGRRKREKEWQREENRRRALTAKDVIELDSDEEEVEEGGIGELIPLGLQLGWERRETGRREKRRVAFR